MNYNYTILFFILLYDANDLKNKTKSVYQLRSEMFINVGIISSHDPVRCLELKVYSTMY